MFQSNSFVGEGKLATLGQLVEVLSISFQFLGQWVVRKNF